MKRPSLLPSPGVILLLPVLCLTPSSGVKATTVFADAFSQTPGTLIVGKAAEVGGAWTGSGAANTTLGISSQNSLDTSGNGRTIFNTFTAPLAAGQVLTLSYDGLSPSTGNFLAGWSGVSLFTGGSGGTEQIFTGDPATACWGRDGGAFGSNHQQGDGDTNVVNHLTFTYEYDTGAYTFATSAGMLSGTATAHLALNALRVANGSGGDINVDNLTVDISPVGVFAFSGQTPTAGTYGASRTNAISVQATDGAFPVNPSSIVMRVDGSVVIPTITKTSNVTTISYVPNSPLSGGTLHAVMVTLADNRGTAYTNTWSFTTGFPSLPATLSGPFVVSNGVDFTCFTAAGDDWLGTNYQSTSSKTLYVSFGMEYNNTNHGTPLYTWGGLEFYQGSTEKLLVGKEGGSANWSVGAGVPSQDIPPTTAVVTNEWHTLVVRIDFSPGVNASANVWLDPDFSQTEDNQPNAPLALSLDNTFDSIRLRCGFNDASATYSNIVVSSASFFAPPVGPQFQSYVPGINASSAPVATPIGVEVVFGSFGIGTNAIAMTLDGTLVSPGFTVNPNSIEIGYQPRSAFAPGSAHTVTVNLTDSNNTPYSTTWSFTADSYPVLPVTMAGPFDVTSGLDVTLWNTQNGWLGVNYGVASTNTLYTRFSMVFYDFPQTVAADGGSYGGLHFFQDNTERLLVGNAWVSTNWSVDAKESGEPDLLPVTPIVAGEWHTMVVKSVYSSNAPASETIWLDPDFTHSLAAQPRPPLTVSLNNTFNQVRLRCGNGATYAEFADIVIAATAEDLGFPMAMVLSIDHDQLSWSGGGTLQSAPTISGPWTKFDNTNNPQILNRTNAAQFFRLQQ